MSGVNTLLADRTDFLAAWRAAWWAVLRDKGVLLLLMAAPIIYGFFYPSPYAREVVRRVPVAVVDQDHSGLSRQITRFAMANPRIDVQLVTGDLSEARRALWRGEIEGYALLPADLKRQVVRGTPAVVTIEGNGAYALLSKAVLYGFSEAVGTVSAGIEIRKLQASGQSATQAASSRNPLTTQVVPLFNPTEGYGAYVVPAVALLILQQTLLMGAAMLSGTWAEQGRLRATPQAWLGRVGALSCFGVLSGLFYFGWVFALHDYPRGGNPLGALFMLACYVPAVAALGLLLGSWLKDRERAMQVMLFTSLPMAFVSGFSWPTEALPAPLYLASWLLPSTLGIQASLRLNQMGAPLADVLPYLLGLLALLGVALVTLWTFVSRPAREAPPRPPSDFAESRRGPSST